MQTRRIGLEHVSRQGSVYEFQRQRGVVRDPISVSDLRALRESSRDLDDGCGCLGSRRAAEDSVPKTRTLDGDWLARTLASHVEGVAELAGCQVEVSEDAWWAIRAISQVEPAARGRADRIARRRARLWPPAPDCTCDAQTDRGYHARHAIHEGRIPQRDPNILTLPDPVRGVIADNDCGCSTVRVCPARFVDALAGSDLASGGFKMAFDEDTERWHMTLQPWQTLRQVEYWLNDAIYGTSSTSVTPCLTHAWVFLKRGETWDGTEELAAELAWDAAGLTEPVTYQDDWSNLSEGDRGDYAAMTLQDLKGVAPGAGESRYASYVLLSSYGSSTAALPIIDGSPGAEPQYGDTRRGILVLDCCRLSISNIDIRGFGYGIDVRGACLDHLYSGLTLRDHAVCGIRVGIDVDRDLDVYVDSLGLGSSVSDDDIVDAMSSNGVYPEDIKIEACTLSSNGYDTSGADIGLSFMATNCTISSNQMTGDATRGIDGIVSQLGSSGHLIEGNTIATHNKLCYSSGTNKAVFIEDEDYCGGVVLLQGCSDPGSSCATTVLGYQIEYYDPSGTLPDEDVIDDGADAFAEDGIDLKGVKKRTDTSETTTVIRNNTIYGHNVTNRTGITLSDGTRGVHIYNNRIFLNAIGILVTNNSNRHPFYENEPTSDVYIYRNLIYMNQEEGVQIKSQCDETGDACSTDYTVSGVYLINNTIAHNLLTGVLITNPTDASTTEAAPDVDHIYLYNNLIARNGIGGDYEGKQDDSSMQVAWSSQIDLLDGTITFGSDYNCYLGWARETDGSPDKVIRARHLDLPSEKRGMTVSEAQDSGTWSTDSASTFTLESNGWQAESLEDLDLADASALDAAETLPLSPDIGDYLHDYILYYDLGAPSAAEAMDYTPGPSATVLIDHAWALAGVDVGALYYGTGGAIPTSPDLSGIPSATPDIGALESKP